MVIPEGRYQGSLWQPEFQPFAYHLLHLMDTLPYRRFAVTGCVQSGKTLVALVFNLCWHLFELRQSVIFMVPELNMAEKKYTDEIEPVINASPFLRRMAYGSAQRFSVPKGSGSRGGFSNTIRFANGCRLEFMGATGNDSRRSSSTAQVVFKTEVDRYDTAAESSREAAAAQTVEDRTASFDDSAYIYEECTMTTVDGRINQQVRKGTDHSVHYPCPHCGHLVRPRRADFVGVEGCNTIIEAKKNGGFKCPRTNCSAEINQAEREAMLQTGVPVAVTQKARIGSDGAALIEGELKPTETFSFWWNAFDNRFWKTATLAAKEWNALYSDDLDDEDKQARQKRWAEPAASSSLDISKLTMTKLIGSTSDSLGRNEVPLGTKWVSAGCDVRETQLHFVVRAWTFDEVHQILQGHAIDVGWVPVERDKYGAQEGVKRALRTFRDERAMKKGFYHDSEGNHFVPGWTLIDAGYKERWVWEFVHECISMGLKTWIPVLGRGQSDPNIRGTYVHPERVDDPTKPNRKVLWIGDECHLRRSSRYADVFAAAGCELPPMYLLINTDEGKAFIRDGYDAPADANGKLFCFKPSDASERDTIQDYRKQLLSEKETLVYVDGRGMVRKYSNESQKRNHYADCDNYACYGVQLCGAPISLGRRLQPIEPEQPNNHLKMPDGRAYMEAGV